MARYLKNLEKHSLLARRKNNTASKMLEGKLKHLEQKHNREIKQYLRFKSRVQSELRDIEDVASEYDEDNTSKTTVSIVQLRPSVEEQPAVHYSGYRGFVATSNRHKKSEMPAKRQRPVNYPNSLKNRSQSVNNSSKTSNPVSENTVVDGADYENNGYSKGDDRSMLSSKVRSNYKQLISLSTDVSRSRKLAAENYHGIDLVKEISDLTVNKSTGRATSQPRETVVLSSDVLCKYSPHSQTFHCRNFPCVSPKTYHTISEGNNQVHVNSERVGSCPSKSTTLNDAKVEESARNPNPSNPALATIVGLQNSSHKNTVFTSGQNHHSDIVRLKVRSVNELGFSRLSLSEPRLDRTGSQPTRLQAEGSNRARVTIKDKIRGLKQMVSEMRAKNDRNKPRDWVVNYGQHFPPRILLNPVMP